MSSESEFQIYHSKKSRRRAKTHRFNHILKYNIQSKDSPYDQADVKNEIDIINKLKHTVETSRYYHQIITILDDSRKRVTHPISQIVCFGIGQFSTCRIARLQLAVILLIAKHLSINTITFHEPAFTTFEIEVLETIDCRVCSVNILAKHQVTDSGTIAFLPHCSIALSNNFLWRNWSAAQLGRIILIANSFEHVKILTTNRYLDKVGNYLNRLVPHVNEQPLKLTDPKVSDVFNDISIHTFERCLSLPEGFFEELPIEPEFVTAVQPDKQSKRI